MRSVRVPSRGGKQKGPGHTRTAVGEEDSRRFVHESVLSVLHWQSYPGRIPLPTPPIQGFLGLILILVAHLEHLMRTGLFNVSVSARFVPMYVRSQPHRGHGTRMLVTISATSYCLFGSTPAGC